MSTRAAITINRPRDEVERLWSSYDGRPEGASVRFADAPGDRGTEIHVDLENEPKGGKLGEIVQSVVGSDPLPKAKDALRRFKQQVETGVIARSDGVPEGELAERKLKQRPAQPLDESELEKAGV
jgi:uncharacterized membrane protein